MSHAVFALPGMPIPKGMNVINTTVLDPTKVASGEPTKVESGEPSGVASGESNGESIKKPSGEPERTLGGHNSEIKQIPITGEYLMKVFTRMLEILNEKKIEKNNS